MRVARWCVDKKYFIAGGSENSVRNMNYWAVDGLFVKLHALICLDYGAVEHWI